MSEYKTKIDEWDFRKKIEEQYLPKQLIEAIFELGEIPETSVETEVGIGFLDIANYTFISKFLSPKENQILLNGFFTIIAHILSKYNGYLNKIEGDSIMFQFGGTLDSRIKKMTDKDEIMKYIAKNLFYTCIEIQKYASKFNQADPMILLYLSKDGLEEKSIKAVQEALSILEFIRNDSQISNTINAFFQIRIRIGANIGRVSVGNFGPEGAKHYDVIGFPVINAKRMESTSPIGGLRISRDFYDILNKYGIIDEYYKYFVNEAKKINGYYQNITKDELFKYSIVILKDKNNEKFESYSVQTNPSLPEEIQNQIELLLNKEEIGSEIIIDIIKYYRGNKYIINAIEKVFIKNKIKIRKYQILKTILPEFTKKLIDKYGEKSKKEIIKIINSKYTLFTLIKFLGKFQDFVKREIDYSVPYIEFKSYSQFFRENYDSIETNFQIKLKRFYKKFTFYERVFPTFFLHIKCSILEFQNHFINCIE